jgi:hypothetical protein
VSRWGKLGWILPQDGEPPILATVLGGSSDGVDHWTETLVNEPPPPHATAEAIGHGPRFFRLQVELDPPIPMDQPEALPALEAAANRLIADNDAELSRIAARLLRAGPAGVLGGTAALAVDGLTARLVPRLRTLGRIG